MDMCRFGGAGPPPAGTAGRQRPAHREDPAGQRAPGFSNTCAPPARVFPTVHVAPSTTHADTRCAKCKGLPAAAGTDSFDAEPLARKLAWDGSAATSIVCLLLHCQRQARLSLAGLSMTRGRSLLKLSWCGARTCRLLGLTAHPAQTGVAATELDIGPRCLPSPQHITHTPDTHRPVVFLEEIDRTPAATGHRNSEPGQTARGQAR